VAGSNREGTALPSGSPRAGNNKFHLCSRAKTAAALDYVVEQLSSRKYGGARPSMQRLTKAEILYKQVYYSQFTTVHVFLDGQPTLHNLILEEWQKTGP